MNNQALTVTQGAALAGPVPSEVMASIKEQAAILWSSGLCPEKFANPEAAIIAALYGRELGLSTARSWKEVYVIDGVPSISTQLMNEKFRQACPDGDLKIEQDDANTFCRISTRRTKGQEWWDETRYTWAEAVAAGLTNKNNWKKSPRDMLYNRAFSRHARRFLPDIVAGFGYTREELEENAAGAEFLEKRQKVYQGDAFAAEPSAPAPQPAPAEPVEVKAEVVAAPKAAPAAIPKRPRQVETVIPDPKAIKPTPAPHIHTVSAPSTPNPVATAPEQPEQKIDRAALLKLHADLQGCPDKNRVDVVWDDFRNAFSSQPETLMQGYQIQADRLAQL